MILHANAALSRRQRERLVGLVCAGVTITAEPQPEPPKQTVWDSTRDRLIAEHWASLEVDDERPRRRYVTAPPSWG
jgi:hypothetical protein